jgi:hypothetical protein
VLSQGPAQDGDVVVEIVLFDRAVGPDALHQLVLGEQASGVLDEHLQRVEHLGSQRHGPAFAQQPAFADLEAKGTELEDRASIGRHSRKVSEKVHGR